MKFKSRKEQREVLETMSSLLTPLMNHLSEQSKEAVKISLRILSDTEYEGENKNDNCDF